MIMFFDLTVLFSIFCALFLSFFSFELCIILGCLCLFVCLHVYLLALGACRDLCVEELHVSAPAPKLWVKASVL